MKLQRVGHDLATKPPNHHQQKLERTDKTLDLGTRLHQSKYIFTVYKYEVFLIYFTAIKKSLFLRVYYLFYFACSGSPLLCAGFL